MSRKTIVAIAKADRAVAIAVFLVLATVGTAAAYNPYADDILARATPTVSQDLAPMQPMKAMAELPSPAELAMVKMLAEQTCLAEAMYYEARGDGARGEEAVAEVVFNRMRDANYPGTICGVVYQGAHHGQCQFSFACDGAADGRKEAAAWAGARALASEILSGYQPLANLTGGAIAYHASYVDPNGWDGMVQTAQIGNQVFYRHAPRHAELRGAI
ncbi:MAG TPA: cell wall hydrolase [Rhizomicrobium sp.]|jgi:spore germination cell wall hydrolase CwlJ-like protein|nr:cell wall hydrolase [Rhizomicrobium sp.]